MAAAAVSKRVFCSASKQFLMTGFMRSPTSRRLFCSASAIVCRPMTGSHVLRVDGYSHLLQMISKGEKVSSSAFNVGGHNWRLDMYPNGDEPSELEQHISVYLRLDSNPWRQRVWASPKFSVLDPLNKPGLVRDVGSTSFKHRGDDWGFTECIDKRELENDEYLKDDRFAIQCDVTVISVRQCSDHVVFIFRKTNLVETTTTLC
ncbi:hypothetical protein QOZ80_6BG0470220 [Eleusine coracana subsp. coracana]|nr:hypothetical protein QOZ80_6BG0470220 [Eleusine coracana subsp. coracana]